MSGGGQGSAGGLGQTQGQLYDSFGFGQGQGLNANTQPSYGGFGGGYTQPSYGGYGQNYNAYAPNFGGSFYNQGPTYQAPMYQTQSAQTTQPQQIGSFQNATASQLQGFVNQPNWSYDDTTGMYTNPLTGAEANTQPVQPANTVSQQDYTRAYRPSNQYQGQLNPNQYYQPIYQQQYQNYYSPYYSQMGAGNNMGMYNTMAQYGYNPYSSFDPYTNSFGGQGYGIDSILGQLGGYLDQYMSKYQQPATTGTTTQTTAPTTTDTTSTTGTTTTAADKAAADKAATTGTTTTTTPPVTTGTTTTTTSPATTGAKTTSAPVTSTYEPQYYDPETGENVDFNTGYVRNPISTGIVSVAPATSNPIASAWSYDDTTGGWVNGLTGAWSSTPGAKQGGLMSLLRKK